jgi:Tol biopolymer transport system component
VTSEPSLTAGAHLGPYEIEALLGAGGMGEVYRAKDTRLSRTVAIKVLPTQLSADVDRRERFRHEAQAISALNHSHIRALYDIGSENGTDFLVMEYLDGETLESRLARRPLSVERTLHYGIQIADALDAAHRQGITHCDVKPGNIMITASGAKLLDFGVAKLWNDLTAAPNPASATTATDVTSVPGTTPYIAPERLEGGAGDSRSDLFAFGVVLYEMLSGRKPFDGPTRARLIASILEHEPAPLTSPTEQIPAPVERVVMRCLAKDPLERWQTARDLASELEWLSRTALTNGTHAAPVRRARTWLPLAAMLAGGAVVGYVAYGAARPAAVTRPADPVRFLAAAPPNSVISVAAGAFSISPNGRHVAFTASSAGGPSLLWVRSLDSFEARPLSGTDGAGFPFWSPDGRTIGFFAGGLLKTVDIDGSPLQIVSESDAQWGTWGRNGDILFTTGPGMFRVRASGGTPEQILSNESPPGQKGQRYGGPEFLPDGEHYLLGVVEPDKPLDQVSIYLGSLQTPLIRELVRADSQAIYAEPGYILYMRAGNLVAQPFDAARLETTGEPTTLPEPAAFVRVQRRASFSVSQTGVIAYRQGIPTSQLTWFDRAGRRLESVGAPGRQINPAISPDGSRIVVTRLAPSITESEIWLLEPRGERPLTSGPGMEDYAVWSPSGERIVYASDAAGFFDLLTKDPTASAEEPGTLVLKTNRHKMPSDFTPDGAAVVYLDTAGALTPRQPLVMRLGVHDTAPNEPIALAPQGSRTADQVQVSPDGHWMAYVSDITGSAQVYVRQFPDGSRRWQVSTDGGFEPKWRGDGRELFYIAADQQMMSVSVTVTDGAFEAGRPTPLFRTTVLGAPYQNGFVRNEYAVTRDGQRFLINEPIGGSAAYAIRVLVNWRSLMSNPVQ